MNFAIDAYDDARHRDQVIALWREVFGYAAAHNAPGLVIDKKREVRDGLFFVATTGPAVIGTVMAGYDGHRGWIYSLAVSPSRQKQGVGSRLLAVAEARLAALGCMKINLQIMAGNDAVENFYLANGYLTEKRISMGKSLPENICPATRPGAD